MHMLLVFINHVCFIIVHFCVGLEKTAAINEGFVESDATDSPNHEFVSDSFQSSHVSEEDIKHGMKMLGVTEKGSKGKLTKLIKFLFIYLMTYKISACIPVLIIVSCCQ